MGNIVRFDEVLADRGAARAKDAKRAAAVVAAGAEVHRPLVLFGLRAGLPDSERGGLVPLRELVLGAGSYAALEPREVDRDLSRVDDNALDWRVKDDLPGPGVAAHLVVRLELVEVVGADSAAGSVVCYGVIFSDVKVRRMVNLNAHSFCVLVSYN